MMRKDANYKLVLICILLAILPVVLSCAPDTSASVKSNTSVSSGNNQKQSGTREKVKSDKQQQKAVKSNADQNKGAVDQRGKKSSQRGQAQDKINSIEGINLLLGHPTDSSVTVNAISDKDIEAYLEYGVGQGIYGSKTSTGSLRALEPAEILLSGLNPYTQYYYRLCYRAPGESQFSEGEEHTFQTGRAAGSGFSFTVEADYHRDQNSDPEEIRITFENILNERPDFNIDLGDTFMCEKFATSYQDVAERYLEDRSYFGIFGHSVPLYLVNGNHEGESGWLLNGTENNIAVWATKARKLYYPNPSPGDFYTGSTASAPFVGQRNSYYAWEWGDALFVVLDPYWYTAKNPKQESEAGNWLWTLGDDQYQWFKKSLETSHAKYKFVFVHHVLGDVRGGVEWADLYEWGGKNRSGVWEFDRMRPGWDAPIHQMMVKNNVSILFQGHDHLFVKQERDGIIYQEVPQPSVASGQSGAINDGSYKSGITHSSPGHLRVSVSRDAVTVDYIHTALTTDANDKYKNCEAVYSYIIH